MGDPGPRRRPPASNPPRTARPLGLIAMTVAVVLAGLAIGASLAAFRAHSVAIPAATELPTAAPTTAASPTAVPALPTQGESPSPEPSPSVTVLAGTPAAVPSAPPLPQPSAVASAAPASATPSLPPASAAPLPAAPSPAAATPRPVATVSFRDTGEGLVRRYLDAVIAGNEVTAYALLGGFPGDRGLAIKEGAFIDRDARIASLKVRQADATTAVVDAEIVTARGTYVATYRVGNGRGGPVIVSHDYIKE